MTDVLCLFAKSPRLGTVKTRLAAAIGDDAALAVYRRLGAQVTAQLRLVQGAAVRIHFTPPEDESLMRAWLGEDPEFHPQRGDDLGARMANALADAFRDGARRVALVGCDAPGLRAHHVETFLNELDRHDMVFIPADDGGYVAVGFARQVTGFLEGLRYGHADVMAETLRRAAEFGLRTRMLETQSDLDTADDMKKFPEIEAWIASRG
ncbi:MAG: TIGR04282 family arsenosugar biosynthesis glycosyltransferase [Deltaproteobacteria bacterium]|nr:TIGR04282 family arsenosugar biosynthesis glycosyltransferase [Deltaproteobacteria bacterium]